MESTDAELVRGVVDGRHDAFEALFRRYRVDVQRHLAGIVRDAAAADDLTQEVFLRLWHRAGQWQGDASLRSWLRRIGTNLALNHLRTVKRRREQPMEIVAHGDADEDDGDELRVPGWMVDASAEHPDTLLAQSEQRHLLRRLVEQLPPDKQEVVHMIVDAEMETRQVAEELGIPEGTVKSRMYHARQRLARSWQQLQAEWEDR